MRYYPPRVGLTFDEELWTSTNEVEVSAGDIKQIGGRIYSAEMAIDVERMEACGA